MKKFVFLCAAATLLAAGTRVQADQITYQFANGGGYGVMISDAGSSATYGTISFNSTPGNNLSVTGGPGATVGFPGMISGSFSIVNSTEVGGPGSLQTASVLSSGGQLTITDGGGHNFVAGLTFSQISDFSGIGGLTTTVTANLTPLSYSGTNADLQTLLNSVNDKFTLSFQYSTADLYTLTTSGGDIAPPPGSSYSATLTADPTPEPSSLVLLGLGSLGMVGYRWRRRTRLALA